MIREYTPSNPANIDKAIKEIEKLGVRNPINPKEIVIDNSVFVEVSNWDKRLWFSSLHSMDRGKGNASRVMQKIVDIAAALTAFYPVYTSDFDDKFKTAWDHVVKNNEM